MIETLHLTIEDTHLRFGSSVAPEEPGARELEDIETRAWSDLYERAPKRIREVAGIGLERVGGAVVGISSAFDVLAFNRVLGRVGAAGVDDATLARLAERYRAAGVRRAFLPRPPGLDAASNEALAARGWRLHNRWVKLWRPAGAVPVVDSSLMARPLSRREMPSAAAVLALGFGVADVLGALLASTMGARGWQHFGIDSGGRVVAVGGLFVDGDVAWMGPAATLPEHRGRGAQKVLVAARIAAAEGAGCRLVVSETAEPRADKAAPSFHNLRRLGFVEAYRRTNHVLELA
jgi:GNAT superfamily N-acetyltransferase